MLIWHKTLGLGAVIAGAVHGWGQSSLSGVGLIVCMSLMPVSYMALRLVDFNYFYFAHILLYFVIIFFAVLHGATMFALSGIVYGAELALRTFLMNRRLTATAHPIDSNHVLLTFPKPFSYKAGQYCFVAIKEVSMIEIHPFSICSSPGDGEMAFCIKNSGDWTAKLMQVVGSVPRSIDISVDGPYGGQTVDFHNVDTYRVVLLICGGVGFTSTLSLFNDLVAHARKCKVNRKIVLIWSTRDHELAAHIYTTRIAHTEKDVEAASAEPVEPREPVDAVATTDGSKVSPDDLPPTSIQAHIFLTNVKDDVAGLAGVPQECCHAGRPQWSLIMADLAAASTALGGKRVAVHVCGPPALVYEVRDRCDKSLYFPEAPGVRFDCQEDFFGF